ncbi:LytTR family DNA-binding domain-containing protein [Arenicella sp.]|nr:LytTR family DNA-binding domain-containing protein [Arenicella sp.]
MVVDDEPLARQRLSRLLSELAVTVVAQGCNGQEALQLTADHDADIVFLDINMPVKNGLTAAHEIVSMNAHPPAIIFCTAYDEYALEAFRTDAAAYLLKPVNTEALAEAITKAQRVSRVQIENWLAVQDISETVANSLVIKSGAVTENVVAERFVYFYVSQKNVYAKQIDKPEMLIDYTLKDVEALLKNSFIRIHRNCLVNRSYIQKMIREETGSARLKLTHSDKEFDVSRRHLREVKKCF